MNSIAHLLISYILLYKYTTLFVVVFSAAVILPLPVNIILAAIGAFSSNGYLNIFTVFFIALFANTLGDTFDYFITRRYVSEVKRQKYIAKYVDFFAIEKYVEDHPRKTIFISRFIGLVSPLVNFLAGFAGVPASTFLVFDIFGNALEIGLFLWVGHTLGNAWNNLSSTLDIVEAILLGATVLFVSLVVVRKRKRE